MPLLDQRTEDAYIKMMFGDRARHIPGRLVLQRVDRPNGLQAVMVVGLCENGADFIPNGFEQALIVGDYVVRPHQVFTGREFIGSGATSLLTGGGVFPASWSKIVHEGTVIDNPTFEG